MGKAENRSYGPRDGAPDSTGRIVGTQCDAPGAPGPERRRRGTAAGTLRRAGNTFA